MRFEEIKGKPWQQSESRDWASVDRLPILKDDPNEEPLPLCLTITDVKRAVGVNIGGKVVDKNVLFFKQNPYISMPMMLNATNQKTLSRLCGSRLPEKWIGKTIVLHYEKTRNPQGGGPIPGLRIVAALLPADTDHGKIMLRVSSPNFEEIKKWLATGNKLEQVEAKYYIEPGAKRELERINTEQK